MAGMKPVDVVVALLVALGVSFAEYGQSLYFARHRPAIVYRSIRPLRPGPVSGHSASGRRRPAPPAASQGFNLMLLGVDTWSGSDSKSRADMIMVAHIDRVQKRLAFVSVPRDTRIAVTGLGYTKLNHLQVLGEQAGGNRAGTRATLKAAGQLLDCTIPHYIKVNFRGFREFVDNIGGIDVELERPVKLTYAHVTLPAGKSHINGATALDLARERHSLRDGDFGRQRNQLAILKAMALKLVSPSYFSQLIPLIRRTKAGIVDTDLSDTELLGLAWTFRQIPWTAIHYWQIPGKADYARDPLTRSVVYYWIPDLAQAKRIAAAYLR